MMNYKSRLMSFYFGSVSDSDRLLIERELLADPETLVDYFDLKRKIEVAQEVPQGPSSTVWLRLQGQLKPRPKFVLPLGMGLAAGLVAVVISVLFLRPNPSDVVTSNADPEILFDTNSEFPANANIF